MTGVEGSGRGGNTESGGRGGMTGVEGSGREQAVVFWGGIDEALNGDLSSLD